MITKQRRQKNRLLHIVKSNFHNVNTRDYCGRRNILQPKNLPIKAHG